jgi:cyclic pyranopterin phosphate synthase
MPAEGIPLVDHTAILSFEEIYDIVTVAVELGIDKVRLTGGEPLVRKGVVDLVGMLRPITGLKELCMTTNGILLSAYAQPLKFAGLDRINISLDTIDPNRFSDITRGGHLQDVFDGIDAANAAGFLHTKLNCVIEESPLEPMALGVAAFAEKEHLQIRYIKRMETEYGKFSRVIGGDGGHCESCNRLRISSHGIIYPCLFDDISFSIRELGIRNALLAAINGKPEKGEKSTNHLSRLGG